MDNGNKTFKQWLLEHQEKFQALSALLSQDAQWNASRVKGNAASTYVSYVGDTLEHPELKEDMQRAYHGWQKERYPWMYEEV